MEEEKLKNALYNSIILLYDNNAGKIIIQCIDEVLNS